MTVNKLREIHDFIMSGGRTASVAAAILAAETRVSEMVNGVLVSKPLKKVEYINESEQVSTEEGPEIIELGVSRAASVRGINKAKAIHDFFISKGRR